MKRKALGYHGEDAAALYLTQKGYQILERNYQKRSGEIDLIAFDPKRKETVFVEVKTRRNRDYGYPEESVGRHKLQKMASTADQWLQAHNLDNQEWRLDVIGIEPDGSGGWKFNHIENISY